ncbi:hypothetical protein ACFYV7_15095 [Nocardia suismassiliense]|uniref:Uncharacterized protein n=1 Tax=Nocardia suismassiliense TaxID=2077092 RepID=A0ABW6QSA1_9NOCA
MTDKQILLIVENRYTAEQYALLMMREPGHVDEPAQIMTQMLGEPWFVRQATPAP